MTIIFENFTDIVGKAVGGYVKIRSADIRPGVQRSGMVTNHTIVVDLVDGQFRSPELDPGPTVITLRAGYVRQSWTLNIPMEGEHELGTLIADSIEYTPQVVGQAQSAASAAAESASAAEASASAAEASAQSTSTDRTFVATARTEAEGARDSAVAASASATDSATAATASETAAGASATAAKASEDKAKASETAAAGSATAAKASETAAGVSATEAAADAARAESAAAGVDQVVSDAADVLVVHIGDVAGQVADDADAAQAARDGAEAARDETSGVLAQKADLVGGVVPSSQIPAVAMTRPHVVADMAGLLALDVQEGDVGIIPDGVDGGSYMLGTGPASEFSSWKRLVTPEAPVSSVNGQTGTVTLGAGDVGAATAGDVAAVTGRVSALESSRATRAEMQARPAFWLWDGTEPWTAPAHAQPGDTVLNTATKEIHRVEEVA